jgi:hypothetical protein
MVMATRNTVINRRIRIDDTLKFRAQEELLQNIDQIEFCYVWRVFTSASFNCMLATCERGRHRVHGEELPQDVFLMSKSLHKDCSVCEQSLYTLKRRE